MQQIYNVFEDFIKRIVSSYQERVTIVLFGSRARGDYWPSSDYDLMIFLEHVDDEMLEATKILQLREEKIPVDVIVKNASEINDPIVTEMLKHKKILFDGLKIFS